MDLGGVHWTFLDIIGPALLAAVLLWAVLRNRRSKRGDETESGTRRVYDEEERARREGGDGRA